ncbi:hypothetical protein [Hydrogenophaga palleronii]|uniref:hypothetical protein n=1 Tax=Hydrogenophaga palleronii TaxID=65655 RepID=UPI00082507E5|nr:hypothetical protein [Hydrogenophaga palleronii]
MSLLDTLTSPAGLRRVLAFDAIAGGATGVLHLGLAGPLSGLLGLPAALLQGTGVAIFAFVSLAAWLAMQAAPPRAALTTLALGNFAWVIGCVAVGFGAAPAITPWGMTYALMQAVVVLVLAELQWMAPRRQRPALLA